MQSFALICCGLLAVASAQLLAREDAEYDPNPQYSYSYDIQDALTGDVKSQTESRNGDAVQGSYSLIEADGSRRIVDYTADPVNGFNAVVRKEAGTAPVAAPIARVAAPVAVARPIAYSRPLPLARVATVAHAPVATYAHAPVTTYAHAPIATVAHAPVAHATFSAPYASYTF